MRVFFHMLNRSIAVETSRVSPFERMLKPMRTSKQYIFPTMLVTLLFLLAGCGMPGVTAGAPSTAQMIQNSVGAMSKLKSAHVDFQANVNLASNTSSTSTNSGSMTFNVTGHSDVAGPNQVSVDLQLGSVPVLSLVSNGQKIYIRGKNGTWYFLEKGQLKDGAQNFFSQSLTQRMGQILGLLQNAKLIDHGQEALNGQTLEHITATFDQQTLQQLSTQLNGLLSANVQSQLQKATLDLWIDQSTWYIHQAQLDVVAQAQVSLKGKSTSVSPADVKLQFNFSKFNAPVNIQVPANAVPLPQS